MSKIRYKNVKVERWSEEEKKIYLWTDAQIKYRYIGIRTVEQIETEFPKGTFLKMGIIFNGNIGLVLDDYITRYWVNQKDTP